MSDFRQLCDEIVDFDLTHSPEFATWAGFHERDAEVADHSPGAAETANRARRALRDRLTAINEGDLSPSDQVDHGLALSTLNDNILGHETIRMAERSPDAILEGFCWGIFSLAKRTFAPAETRLRSAIGRLEKAPSVFAAARARLVAPSAIPVDISKSSLRDTIPFFTNSLPRAFAEVTNVELQQRLGELCEQVAGQYREFGGWLETLNADAPFAIGEEAYAANLRDVELVDISPSEVLAAGERELERLSRLFDETAKEIDPSKTPHEVFEEMAADHPAADQLIPYTQGMLEDLRQFCVDRKIVTFPSENRCHITPTPEFARELTFASMDTPGPFETNSTEAFYNVTTALPEWSAETTEQHMRAYNRCALTAISVHEAYPGHYTQFTWQDRWPTKLRKVYGSYSAVEGWAHLAEELMVEQGYMDFDPRFRLGQLHEALLRAVRLIVGISMHCAGMSVETGTNLFMEKAKMERVNAEREARRGTTDPFYCNYTLGKMLLKELRQDYMAANPGGTLLQFHDAFLAEGYPPLPLVRRKLLGEVGRIL